MSCIVTSGLGITLYLDPTLSLILVKEQIPPSLLLLTVLTDAGFFLKN